MRRDRARGSLKEGRVRDLFRGWIDSMGNCNKKTRGKMKGDQKKKCMVGRFADGIDAWFRRSLYGSVSWIWHRTHTWVAVEDCIAGGSVRSFRIHAIPKCS